MDQHEKYLYDLQGYITVPDALDADQLRRLNEEVDRHIEAECPSDMTTHRFFDTIDWGGPLLELIDNPAREAVPRRDHRRGRVPARPRVPRRDPAQGRAR